VVAKTTKASEMNICIYRQRTCGFVVNAGYKSEIGNVMGLKNECRGKRLDGIIFTFADLRYARKLNDLQGGNTKMWMKQVR